MDDHDQRLKILLREFLPEFFELFFPEWAGRFDFTGAEFLDQEAFLDPPQGEKRLLDVVAKVATRESVPDPGGRDADHWLVVVHVEVESSRSAADIRPRMWQYYDFLRRQHRLPVLPICLFLRVGLDGIGWDAYEERFWDHLLMRFEYSYVGLPTLDGTKYATGANVLGVALSALMKLPAADRARIKAEGLDRIARSRENDAKKYLLAECFDNYLPLNPAQAAEYERMQAERFAEGKVMATSFEERGRLKGARQMVRKMLDKRFGPLAPDVLQQLETLSIEKLEEIALAFHEAKSLDELGLGTAAAPDAN
jgi:hypothetical protein